MGQITSLFNERQEGNLPSTSEMNPRRDGREHCKAITLRSRKTVDRPIQDNAENDENSVGNSRNSDELAEKSAKTIGKEEKLLKHLASNEQRKSELKAPSKGNTPVVPYPQR